jgi:broad specificity phosphatase PhoE
MSTLLVVRHGQASFGQADYDRLTPVGVEQSARLGAYLAASGRALDRIVVGPRRRQQDTAAHMLAAFRAGGGRAPDPELVHGLDEYPAEAIMRRALPALPAEARAMLDAPIDARAFQVVFERVMHKWVGGELAADDTESFGEFAARVRVAIHEIVAGAGRGRTVCVVTSAGPTAIACQMALDLPDPMALKQSWVVANTGTTEIKFRGDEMTLVVFNALPHIRDQRLVTYR